MEVNIGDLFWRVEYKGVLTQYKAHEIHKDGKVTFKLARVTNLKDGYKIEDNIEYIGSSTFSLDIIDTKDEFFTDYEKAKESSILRYYKEENPNGKYIVGKYFDGRLESYVSDALNKKEARIKANELNEQSRYYVRFDIVAVK